MDTRVDLFPHQLPQGSALSVSRFSAITPKFPRNALNYTINMAVRVFDKELAELLEKLNMPDEVGVYFLSISPPIKTLVASSLNCGKEDAIGEVLRDSGSKELSGVLARRSFFREARAIYVAKLAAGRQHSRKTRKGSEKDSDSGLVSGRVARKRNMRAILILIYDALFRRWSPT